MATPSLRATLTGLALAASALLLILLPAHSETAPLTAPELRFKRAFEVGGQPSCAFIQDRDGFIWVGSISNGLARFDGQETKRYKEGAQTLASNFVTQLYEDSRGLIWIGTGAGLTRYDKSTDSFTSYFHDARNPNSLADDNFPFSAAQIAEDQQGRMWFGTHGGLSRLDRGSQQFINYRHLDSDAGSIASDDISAVTIDDQGAVWLAFRERGLDRLDPKTGVAEHFRHRPNDATSLPFDNIIGITAGKDGVLWLASTHNGLIRFDTRARSFKSYSNEKGNPYGMPKLTTWAWKLLANGLLTPLQSTDSAGLVFFDPVTERTQQILPQAGNAFSIGSNGVQGVIEGAQGRLWLVLSSGLVQLYDPKAVPLKLLRNDPLDPTSLASNVPVPIYEDRAGRIWIGHFGAGLDLYLPETGGFRHFKRQLGNPKTLPHNYPTGFMEDELGNFYVSTYAGLVLFDRKRMEVTEQLTKGTSFYALVQDLDQPDLIWASGWQEGLCSLDRKTKKVACQRSKADDKQGLGNDTALRMVVLRDQPQYLWLATWGGGLERFERKTRSFTHFRNARDDPHSISSNTVYDLREDRKGRLWLATANGLNLFDKATQTFTRFTSDNGFPASVVHNIQQDDAGDLWLASDAGLIRFDPEARVVRKIFTTEDGAHGTEFFPSSGLKTRDGRLFFGGFKGLNLFRPADIQRNDEVPKVYLTGLRQSGRDLALPRALEHVQALTFDAEHNSFDFDFVAHGFTNAAQNQYAYRMEGLDKEWQMVGHRRSGRYSNLPPGDFVLHIKAANNDGVWNEQGLRIAVRVVPPFWRTWPFYILAALCTLGLAYAVYRLRVKSLQRQNERLETLVDVRTRELKAAEQEAQAAAQTKSMFLANMSHEIRTPMNAIIGLAHLVSRTELSERQRDYLKKIEQSGRHLLGILNDILDFSKVESGKLAIENIAFELDTMLQEVVTVVAPKAQEKGLEFICVTPADVPQQLVGDPLRLAQILINYLNNAIKFTQTGEVTLRVEGVAPATPDTPQDADAPLQLRFSVQDTGIGLSPEQKALLFQSFAQADASTTRKFGGTGLGLAISKRLAELMGGTVGVDSSAGQGSTFWFTARLQRNLQAPAAKPRNLQMGAQRLLVVDDHPIAAQTVALHLEQLGLRADMAYSGREALEAVRKAAAAGDAYTVVFLDWQMPEWDGLLTAEKIKAAGLAQTPQFILVTGHGRDEIMQLAEAAGLSEILLKPVSASTLIASLLRVVNGANGGEPYAHAAGQATAFAKLSALRGADILLVEDNALNQQVASELLQWAGFNVDIADNGQIALERVANKRYDLVLMDMQMPVMDGLTATTHLRADPANKDLPIIAMTANAMQSDRDLCLAAGMNGFVTKPIEPEQLEAALLMWITPRPGLGQGDAAAPAPADPTNANANAQTQAQTQALITAVASVQDLDVEHGLQRMLGNQRLYLEMIQGYCESQEAAFTEMLQGYRRGDLVLVERLAHTLKGLSGNIGAAVVQTRAGTVEALMRDHANAHAIDAQLTLLNDALQALLKSIRAAIPEFPASRAATDPASIQNSLRQLRQLLEEEHADSLSLLREQRETFRAALGAHYVTLAAAVEQFDFELALATLDQVAEPLGH